MRYMKVELPPDLYKLDSTHPEAFRTDTGLGILKSIDNTPKWGPLKHVSISREDRYPNWDEILRVKDFFFGNIDCMMVIPKSKNYVNVHPNCFHIWQTPQEWNIT